VHSSIFGKGPAGKSLAQPLPAARGPKQAHVAFVFFSLYFLNKFKFAASSKICASLV
jgi:hypothetical protein